MKLVIKLFALIIFTLLSFISFVFAAESGDSSAGLDFLWKVINFVVLIGIIYWFARKPVGSAMNASAENAKNQLDEARRAESKAIE
ncbi:MAG: ATP synthase F0 subunit B, partial [SAR324 cluster bacterium]|nr:ATP synthase F0 subunit B [SAR324 cluster bacterium]